jgi:hypothetical protein
MSAHDEIMSRHQSFIAAFADEDYTGMREYLTTKRKPSGEKASRWPSRRSLAMRRTSRCWVT